MSCMCHRPGPKAPYYVLCLLVSFPFTQRGAASVRQTAESDTAATSLTNLRTSEHLPGHRLMAAEAVTKGIVQPDLPTLS